MSQKIRTVDHQKTDNKYGAPLESQICRVRRTLLIANDSLRQTLCVNEGSRTLVFILIETVECR